MHRRSPVPASESPARASAVTALENAASTVPCAPRTRVACAASPICVTVSRLSPYLGWSSEWRGIGHRMRAHARPLAAEPPFGSDYTRAPRPGEGAAGPSRRRTRRRLSSGRWWPAVRNRPRTAILRSQGLSSRVCSGESWELCRCAGGTPKDCDSALPRTFFPSLLGRVLELLPMRGQNRPRTAKVLGRAEAPWEQGRGDLRATKTPTPTSSSRRCRWLRHPLIGNAASSYRRGSDRDGRAVLRMREPHPRRGDSSVDAEPRADPAGAGAADGLPTTIAIAHRLSTMRSADQICVLQARDRERATHEADAHDGPTAAQRDPNRGRAQVAATARAAQ